MQFTAGVSPSLAPELLLGPVSPFLPCRVWWQLWLYFSSLCFCPHHLQLWIPCPTAPHSLPQDGAEEGLPAFIEPSCPFSQISWVLSTPQPLPGRLETSFPGTGWRILGNQYPRLNPEAFLSIAPSWQTPMAYDLLLLCSGDFFCPLIGVRVFMLSPRTLNMGRPLEGPPLPGEDVCQYCSISPPPSTRSIQVGNKRLIAWWCVIHEDSVLVHALAWATEWEQIKFSFPLFAIHENWPGK